MTATLQSGRSVGESLIATLIAEQQALSAVDKFAKRQDSCRHRDESEPLQARYYRDLLPASPPAPGQQYAFDVSLDDCTGCKACVTACHNLNGLDDGEVWRSVGLLHGGTREAPVQVTVTTACHHCLDPSCLLGCPVLAYEKDPVTGIVRHLDDQCIGCQYCIFTCPYDVPQYNAGRGIVRKCDMCSVRLARDEAPACVQACPNQAIRIRVVDVSEVVEDSETGAFLPGAPPPEHTFPTTIYRTERSLPRNLVPGDYYSVAPQHSHPALVAFLVLSQLAAGAFVLHALLSPTWTTELRALLRPYLVGAAAVVGWASLLCSAFHLGRPRYAFRAILGLRTSWLSREVAAFAVFAVVALLAAALLGARGSRSAAGELLAVLGAASGAAGVFSSVMVYGVTAHQFWRPSVTGLKFTVTAVLLGAATTASTAALVAVFSPPDAAALWREIVRPLLPLIIGASGAKMLLEASIFVRLRDRRNSPLRRSAHLLRGQLAPISRVRFALGLTGGLGVPLGLLWFAPASGAGTFWVAGTLAVCLVSVAGELLERHLFFAALASPYMPRGLP